MGIRGDVGNRFRSTARAWRLTAGAACGKRGRTHGMAAALIGAATIASAAPTTAGAQVIGAQTSTAYQEAIAAGYKALALCEGVIAAGRTEAQV